MVDDAALPITEHLAELRKRLCWIVGALALGTAISFNQAEAIFGFLDGCEKPTDESCFAVEVVAVPCLPRVGRLRVGSGTSSSA